jgi:hypothetical protein
VLSAGRIRSTIAVAALIWAGLLLAQGADLDGTFIKPLSGVMGLTVALLGAYDRWLWKLGPLRRLQKQPILHGTWKGSLQTAWCDRETGEIPGPIQIYMVVRQTCSSIAFSMYTAESSSRSVSAALDDSESGAWVLSGTYINTPQLLLQDRSRVHRGSAVLEVHRGSITFLEGSYWTDRDSKGSMRFTEHADGLPTHFEQAQSVFT